MCTMCNTECSERSSYLFRPSRPANELSGAQGKLMRMVEEQLAMGDGPVDLVHLSNQFGLADRLHRDSLSHGEVITYPTNISPHPLLCTYEQSTASYSRLCGLDLVR